MLATEVLAPLSAAAVTVISLLAKGYFDNQRESRQDKQAELRHKWDAEDRNRKQAEVVGKVDESTVASTKAVDVANHVTEKLTSVAAQADQNAVASMAIVMVKLDEHSKEIAAIRATGEETRRMVQVRIGDQIAAPRA